MLVRSLSKEKSRDEEWGEIKEDPPYFFGLVAKRWPWFLLLCALLILFIVVLLMLL